MTTASGMRELPHARRRVWWALTAVTPYCAVCDVSYVYPDRSADELVTLEKGTRFLCVPGRLDGFSPPPDAVRGEVVEWTPLQRFGTRLQTSTETWWTCVQLDGTGENSTVVTIAVGCEPVRGGRLPWSIDRRRRERMARRTVDLELAKLTDHVRAIGVDERPALELEQGSRGGILHLRGHVDARAVTTLALEGHLHGATAAIDVADLTYLDASALPLLHRWARDVRGAGGEPLIRGSNEAFDRVLADFGLGPTFARRP